MAKTVFLNKNFKIDSYLEGYDFSSKKFFWTHFVKNEKNEKILGNLLNQDKSFIDDLVENQRPNVKFNENFNSIVLSFPIDNSNFIQITFIFYKNSFITFCNNTCKIIDDLMKNISEDKRNFYDFYELFYTIIDKILENSIFIIDEVSNFVEKEEIKVFKNNIKKNFFSKISKIKEYLFIISRIIRGDIEVFKELSSNKEFKIKKSNINQLEDRLLFLNDNLELIKETINNVNNNYMNLLSHSMNKSVYKLTVIGAIMIIPAIIAGLFGMNVTLPNLNFNEILGLIIGLCAFIIFISKQLL